MSLRNRMAARNLIGDEVRARLAEGSDNHPPLVPWAPREKAEITLLLLARAGMTRGLFGSLLDPES